MAQITEYANFIVYFSDDALYNFAVGLAGGTSALTSPKTIADLFGFVDGVNYNTGGPLNPIAGMYGLTPYGLATPPGPGYEVGFPNPSGKFLSWDVDYVIVPGQAGNPASIFPAGPDLKLVWCAVFVKQAAQIASDAEVAPIPLRRWIMGFEWFQTADGMNNPYGYSRDASRTLDGIGCAQRGTTNTATRNTNQYVTPLNPYASWERWYVRIRQFGVLDCDWWKSVGSPSPGNGIALLFKSDGSIDVYNVNASLVYTLLTNTGPIFTLNEFVKLDLLVNYNEDGSPGTSGRFRLLANGTLLVDEFVPVASAGIGAHNTHAGTTFGSLTPHGPGWEIDYDDVHNAEIPSLLGSESLTSVDFILGTHVRAHKVNTATLGSWTGQDQSMNQAMIPANVANTSILTSSISADAMEGFTDADDTSDNVGTIICAAAAVSVLYNKRASGTTAGALGYRLAGGTLVTSPTVESSTARYNTTLWPGDGTKIVNDSIIPASVYYQKAADTILNTVFALGLMVQYVGMWGTEDGSESDFPRLYLTHNAAFPNIAQAFLGPSPGPALAAVKTGTYVGNGTEQQIQLPLPFCFLWIRPVGISNAGAKFFGAITCGHAGISGGLRPDLIVRQDFDATLGITTFTVVGTNNETNANGTTYHYIAICDPSFFFNLCGAYIHSSGQASATNPLIDPNFTPQAAFIFPDSFSSDNTTRLIYKGPGHVGTDGTLVSGTDVANVGLLGTGVFVSGSDAQESPTNDQIIYSLFRGADDCSNIMFQIFSYTGDGTGVRTISCIPTSLRYATFVYIQPHNAIGILKDASDVGTSSRTIAGTPTANGVTAVGIDSITVASSLNSNGIIYEVFIILGDTSGFIDGTFIPTPCLPTELVTPPTPPIGLNILPEGGIILGGTTPQTLLKDVSGIYTIVPGKRNDTLYDRLTGQSSVDVAIPNPRFKTGYIGG